ncbi:glutathione S-transferase kappa 1-like, partial [Pseudonaja textilis]
MLPKRGEYLLKDISRLGKYCQVPVNSPKDLVNTVIVKGSLPAMRFITAVDTAEPQFLESVSRELWMRIWSRDEDIIQPESILAVSVCSSSCSSLALLLQGGLDAKGLVCASGWIILK